MKKIIAVKKLVTVRKEVGFSSAETSTCPDLKMRILVSKCLLVKGLESNVREFGSHAEGNGKPVKDLM